MSNDTILNYIRGTRSSWGFHCGARLEKTGYPTGYGVTPGAKEG